jgi:AraC-like DNA-binding protein
MFKDTSGFIDLIKTLPPVKDFFTECPHGYDIPLPQNILLFYRGGVYPVYRGGAIHHRYLLNFNLGAPCELNLDRQSFVLPENSIFLIRPFASHFFAHTRADIFRFMISFYCRNEEILPEAHLPVMLNDELMEAAGWLIKEYKQEPTDMWNLSLLLTLLLNKIKQQQLNTSSELVLPPGASFSHKVAQYITRNLNRDLSLPELAKEFHISVSQLRRKFFAETEVSVGKHIQQRRLYQAAALLCKTEHSISEIAELCGYTSIQAFSRAFHNRFKQTPQSYRKERI